MSPLSRRPLPNLQYEQDILRELFSQYDPDLDQASKRNHGVELCRLIANTSVVRTDLIYPACLGRAPAGMVAEAQILLGLTHGLMRDLHAADAEHPRYDALVKILDEQVERLDRRETGPDGLWAAAAHGGLDLDRLDVEIGRRLKALDAETRRGVWTPRAPTPFEMPE